MPSRTSPLVKWTAIAFLGCAVCPALHAQSVADAAREAREKKQKKQADSAKDASAKPKVITNEDLREVRNPEAKSPEAKVMILKKRLGRTQEQTPAQPRPPQKPRPRQVLPTLRRTPFTSTLSSLPPA
jgi:hypothetical protein